MILNLTLICGALLLGVSALGSIIGVSIVGYAAIGAWKKCLLSNKPAPMILIAFVSNPVTQIFYAYILMIRFMEVIPANPENAFVYLVYCVAATAVLFITALIQGKIGAYSVEAICETHKGFAQCVAVLGVAETVALFTMVFTVASI